MELISAKAKLQQLREELKNYFKEREDEVDGLLVALLCRHHVLLIGPPGTAKSMLARTCCEAVAGGKFYYTLLDKFTTPKDLFVSEVIIEEKEQNGSKLIRFINQEGALPVSHVIFLDETFKCNGPSLNSLLLLLNERQYAINPGEVRNSPLITLVGASNELPREKDELSAFLDRFLLRFEVKYLTASHKESSAFVQMLKGVQARPGTKISFEELELLQKAVDETPISDKLLWTINAIRATLSLQYQIQPSDRRYKEAIRAVRAYAMLNDHSKVTREDLSFLEHILWISKDKSERDPVRRVIYENTKNKDLSWACDLYDEADKLHREGLRLQEQAYATIPYDDE